jgi:hypothetical protein
MGGDELMADTALGLDDAALDWAEIRIKRIKESRNPTIIIRKR